MYFASSEDYIRCVFNTMKIKNPDGNTGTVDIYFARTKDIITEFQELKNHICKNDLIRADKFHFEEDRETWLCCHTLLRIVLSEKLGIESSYVNIYYDRNNKPWLEGNPLFFNISHTRETFAFAISDFVRIGIDIEKIDRSIDFESIIRTFFSPEEMEFILADPENSRNRFFLLWTRKEALLKALGTGIIDNLTDVEVFREVNVLKQESFDNIVDNSFFCDHFIYSREIMNNYISIALPRRAKITLNHLDAERVKFYLGV